MHNPITLYPRMLFTGDNLPVLRAMANACIDLVYTDPPFNSKRMYTAPLKRGIKASFKDTWNETDLHPDWHKKIAKDHPRIEAILKATENPSYCAYLTYMAVRLIEIHRVLKDSGALYLHIDPTMSHYLKVILDCLFGEACFRNEIIWSYGLGGSSPRQYSKKHDTILFYTKSTDKKVWYFDKPQVDATSHRMRGQKKGISDVWTDIPSLNNQARERTGYPTQKPLALLRRIIAASSKKGDWVLDPFCGCATACVAAEELQRHWIGIDLSKDAYNLINRRLQDSNVALNTASIHYEVWPES